MAPILRRAPLGCASECAFFAFVTLVCCKHTIHPELKTFITFNQPADLSISLNICLESECGANLWLIFSTFPTSIIHAALQYRER